MKNRYGVDVSYHTGKLNQLIRDMDNYKSDELARALLRLAKVADVEVFKESEFSCAPKVKPLVWNHVPSDLGWSRSSKTSVGYAEAFKPHSGEWACMFNGEEIVTTMHETEEEAKEAAQKHYEKLVLGALEL